MSIHITFNQSLVLKVIEVPLGPPLDSETMAEQGVILVLPGPPNPEEHRVNWLPTMEF
jgi:hypothetical protein